MEVVVERLKRFVATNSAFAIELPEVLFRLGIHGKTRVSSRFVQFDQLGDSFELSTLGVFVLGAGSDFRR